VIFYSNIAEEEEIAKQFPTERRVFDKKMVVLYLLLNQRAETHSDYRTVSPYYTLLVDDENGDA
jgi:hypothetical protein